MAPSRPPRPPPRPARDPKDILKKRGADLIRKVSDKDRYAIFLEPVDIDTVDGYANVISRPMDLSTAQKNLQMGVYRTPMELRADLDLIWTNCCTFNADDSIYFKEAVRLRTLANRYYDDLIRALTRDGVAAALGISTPRTNGPAPGRHAQKRLPRSRLTPSHTPAPSPSPHASELDSDAEMDPSPSGSASPSASASAAQMPTFHDTQLRRARAIRDTALSAAKAAAEELHSASLAAGVPPPGAASHHQIFNGPGAILNKLEGSAPVLPAKEFPVASNPQIRDRCTDIPHSWKRIGRWHARGATLSKFLSKERATDLKFGRQYQKFVRKSAPLARRLLATVLDAQVVQLHDMCIMSQVDPRRHQAISGLTQDGSSAIPTPHESSDSYLSHRKVEGKPNGTRPKSRTNGVHDNMEIEDKDVTIKQENGEIAAGSKTIRRPRSSRNASALATALRKAVNEGSEGELSDTEMAEKLGTAVLGNGECAPSSAGAVVSQESVTDLQGLLNKHGIDSSFISGLMKGAKHTAYIPSRQAYSQFVQNSAKSSSEELAELLNSNHATMMNVLRIRALREKASDALDEELECQERDYVEALANGISVAVQNIPPQLVIHAADAAETAMEMAMSSLPQHPKPVQK